MIIFLHTNGLPGFYYCVRMHQLASQLLHIDAYTAQRLFYPELLPMDETLVVEQQFMDRPMPLRRESLLLASVGPERKCAAAFLLDAGVELIVYR